MGESALNVREGRAVFLDRDGVLNRTFVRAGKPRPPSSLADFEYLPGVEAATRALADAGFTLIVVTNQPDLSTGVADGSTVSAMHARLLADLPITEIFMCPHTDVDDCTCRKPKPGLLLAAAERFSIDLESSFMVGDRWRDVGAGRAAGCRTILVGDGYGEKMPWIADHTVASLADAVPVILVT